MRNNEDRVGVADRNTGAETPSASMQAPPQVQQSSNPLLNFVAPTEFVELPSKGRFYSADHPLHKETMIEIKHMTTREEDVLTSEALLRRGIAMDRFLQQIMVDSRIDPDTLLVGDKNAVLVAARVSGYGASYITEVVCPKCDNKNKHEFDLKIPLEKGYDQQEVENAVATDNGTYMIKDLPISGWSIEVRPLNGKDEKKIQKSLEAKKKRKLSENMLSTQMLSYIVSISGITDRIHINEAVSKMPAMDSRVLRMTYMKLMPSIDMTQDFSCAECGFSAEMEVPFTTDFFWPKQ